MIPKTDQERGRQRSGWLLRLPFGVIYWASDDDAGGRDLEKLCRSAASPWELLARVLSGLGAARDKPHWPPLALLTVPDGQPVLVVSGDIPAAVDGIDVHGDTAERADAADRHQWAVWRPAPGAAIQLGAFPQTVTIEGGADLEAGLITGSGALVLPSGAAVPTAFTPAASTPSEEATQVSGIATQPEADFELTAGLPVIHPMEVPADEPVGSPVMPHMAPEEAGTPSSLSAPEAQAGVQKEVQAQAQGPVGSLLWDSGQRYPLERDVIVGRDPSADPRVLDGSASALVPDGPSDGLSGVHAELRLADRGEVVLVDRGSTNGTFVWENGPARWRRLAQYESEILSPGMAFAVAERTCLYEARP